MESNASKKAFFCELCSKGYNRVNEYDAHLSSYDHSHKKRLADMKAMQRPNPSLRRERERKAEEKALGGITIKPISLSSAAAVPGGEKKKSGFKSAFGAVEGGDGAGATGGGGGFKKVFVSLEGKGVTGGEGKKVEKGVEKGEKDRVKGGTRMGQAHAEDSGVAEVWESDTDEGEDGERYDPAYPTS